MSAQGNPNAFFQEQKALFDRQLAQNPAFAEQHALGEILHKPGGGLTFAVAPVMERWSQLPAISYLDAAERYNALFSRRPDRKMPLNARHLFVSLAAEFGKLPLWFTSAISSVIYGHAQRNPQWVVSAVRGEDVARDALIMYNLLRQLGQNPAFVQRARTVFLNKPIKSRLTDFVRMLGVANTNEEINLDGFLYQPRRASAAPEGSGSLAGLQMGRAGSVAGQGRGASAQAQTYVPEETFQVQVEEEKENPQASYAQPAETSAEAENAYLRSQLAAYQAMQSSSAPSLAPQSIAARAGRTPGQFAGATGVPKFTNPEVSSFSSSRPRQVA